MTLRRNILANFLGQGWRLLMSLAFVPVYVKLLGVEAYGLMGIYATLQAGLNLLDAGMKPALAREMARFTGGARDTQSIWDLLRSIELATVGIACLMALVLWASSDWLSSEWVRAATLDEHTVGRAFAIMGIVTAFQFVESVYISSMSGLQRQVLQNLATSATATVRGLGAVGVLMWLSPTVDAFFAWQALISACNVAVYRFLTYRSLPRPARPPRFDKAELLGIWRYAAGMLGITLLALLLTHADKVLLSGILPLESFGYYALASVASGALYALSYPVQAAYHPLFVELLAKGDDAGLKRKYHDGSQLVSVLTGAAAAVLIVFADDVLFGWTGDKELTRGTAPLMAVLALGTVINGLMGMPYRIQLAHGWTSLAVRTNTVAVVLLVPAIAWIVPRYGAMGAAWIWVVLNVGYLALGTHFMYGRILRAERGNWYVADVMLPLVVAAVAALACRAVAPAATGRIEACLVIAASSIVVLMATCCAASVVRKRILSTLPALVDSLRQAVRIVTR